MSYNKNYIICYVLYNIYNILEFYVIQAGRNVKALCSYTYRGNAISGLELAQQPGVLISH